MRIAAIGDVHGNSAALDAVLCDIDKHGVDVIVNVGDHFSGPLDAKGTADRMASIEMTSIRGNHDRWLVEQKESEMGVSDLAAYGQLEQNHLDWLSSLPATAKVDDVFLCHGTPTSDTTYWMERVLPDGVVCMAKQETIEERAVGIDAPVILCGHTHLPRILRLRDGRLLVNPGSVGCPGYDDVLPVPHIVQSGTPDAIYAILERQNEQWSVCLKSISYNAEDMVKLAVTADRLDWASSLTTGWVSYNI